MSNLINKLDNFLKIINFKDDNNFKLIIIIFTSKLCLPCQKIYPNLEILNKKYASTCYFYKVDAQVSPDIFSYCNISNVPTFNIYFKGKE